MREGPDAVISQIHHDLEVNAVKNVVLFCDNCVALNKNNVATLFSLASIFWLKQIDIFNFPLNRTYNVQL